MCKGKINKHQHICADEDGKFSSLKGKGKYEAQSRLAHLWRTIRYIYTNQRPKAGISKFNLFYYKT